MCNIRRRRNWWIWIYWNQQQQAVISRLNSCLAVYLPNVNYQTEWIHFDFVCCNWSAFQLQLNLWNPQLIHVELAFVRIVMWAACQRWSWSWSYLSCSVLLRVMHIVQPHTKSDITVPSQRMPSFVILFLFLLVNLEVVHKHNIWHQEFSETMRLFWISYHFMTRNWDSWETRWL